MKNSLKLSRYLPHHNTRYHHHHHHHHSHPYNVEFHDTLLNDYPAETRYPSICAGCGGQIYDQYLLQVAPDLEWHIQCLKCYECGQYLDETTTCFVLDGKTFCKLDYMRLFASKCAKCQQSFGKNELFMRAGRYRRYHTDCFRCDQCDRLLVPGDEYYPRGPNEILCRQDFDQLHLLDNNIIDSKSICCDSIAATAAAAGTTNNNNNNNNTNHIPLRPPPTSSSSSSTTSSSSNQPVPPLISSNSSNRSIQRKDKTTRMRTVLNEKQLLTLRTCYGANPRPDALMKEQLVEMTALSPRVIRVWFQNKRCKDKKKSILIKQTQEQQKVLTSLGHGIPMIASSPVPNDINIGLPPPAHVEVQYHPGGPWKSLNELSSSSSSYGPPYGGNSASSSNDFHHSRHHSAAFHDSVLSGFASEDDSTCFDTSQFSEERSDTSRDGSTTTATNQLTLL